MRWDEIDLNGLERPKPKPDPVKDALIEHLGGECVVCGHDSYLEFGHADVDNAHVRFADVRRLPWNALLLWVQDEGIQLFCRGCHAKKSGRERARRLQQKEWRALYGQE